MLIAELSRSSPMLRDALAAAPGVAVELEGTAEGPSATVSFLARGSGLDRFETAIRTDETVAETTVRSRGPAFGRYDVTLSPAGQPRTTTGAWADLGAEPLAVTGTSRGWEYRMRFPDRAALAAYRDHCRDRDVSFTLHEVFERAALAEGAFGLEAERAADPSPEEPGDAGGPADGVSPPESGPDGEGNATRDGD